jgi:ABC-type antimicrobial peptide transport system permease subunit
VRPLEAVVDAATGSRRYQMRLFAAFGAVALVIAMLGVYSVTAYGVSRRRREMNIRVALGARSSQVIRLIVAQGLTPVAVGLAAGVAGALAAGTVVKSLLFDVGARDPIVVTATAALVGTIALAACVLAARQGLSLDPAAALRDE